VWLILFIVDVLLLLVGGPNAYIGTMMALSHATKMLAAYFGGKAALSDVLRLQPTIVS
jgi:hypothetical protein